MSARDQAIRATADRSEWQAVDGANLTRLKTIIGEVGFPTEELVGREGVNAAWLIVQHADNDPAFQKEVLARLEAANLRWLDENVALLTDRVLVGQGAAQIYGTQPGRPIDDPGGVDERRARIGLMPLESYNCITERLYGPIQRDSEN